MSMINYPEFWVIGFLALGLVLWLEIKVKKLEQGFRKNLIHNAGLLVLLIGIGLVAAEYLGIMAEAKNGYYAIILGLLLIIIARIQHMFKKKVAIKIEEERREYRKRIRKALTIKESEKIAFDFLKEEIESGQLDIIGSVKRFKKWNIFAEDGEKNKYRVVIDQDGDIENWETLKKIPSWFEGV